MLEASKRHSYLHRHFGPSFLHLVYSFMRGYSFAAGMLCFNKQVFRQDTGADGSAEYSPLGSSALLIWSTWRMFLIGMSGSAVACLVVVGASLKP